MGWGHPVPGPGARDSQPPAVLLALPAPAQVEDKLSSYYGSRSRAKANTWAYMKKRSCLDQLPMMLGNADPRTVVIVGGGSSAPSTYVGAGGGGGGMGPCARA